MPDMIETPPVSNGTNAEKIENLYRYLTRMSEQLNDAMNRITAEQTGGATVQKVRLTQGATAAQLEQQEKTDSEKVYNTLKSMIVKTAKIVRSEMDEISTELKGYYQALSDEFGEYERSLDTQIKATAEGVLANFDETQRVTERLGANEEELKQYIRKLSQYIFMGKIDEDHVGIAIGNNVTAKDEEDNDVLDDANKMATFTMDELAFYVNGVKAAWYSGSTFYIAQGKVEDQLQIGNNHAWRVVPTGNIALVAITAEEEEE